MFVKAKPELRAEARRLRAEQGLSLRRIASRLGVSLSSVSVWVRDVPLSEVPTAGPLADEPRPRRRCPRCRLDLPGASFNRGQGYCRDCFRTYHMENPRHRERVNELKAERVRAARDQVERHLRGASCRDCGEADAVVLEFDHIGPKHCDIATLVNRGPRPARLARELEACEVVCANCHRRRTAVRARWRRLDPFGPHSWRSPLQQRSVLHAYRVLLARGCTDCGLRELVVLDFDHLGRKTASVMDLARKEYAFERVLAEIEQCTVRCANCHRRRTAATAGWYRARSA